MRFSESRKRQVVGTSDASQVGRLRHFVVSPSNRTVTALVLDKTPGDEVLVDWSELQAFGRDAITVTSAESFRAPHGQDEEQAIKGKLDVLGKPVLTERGDGLGELEDVDFDAETGEITALQTSREEVRGHRLIGVGSYAVVVSAPER